MSTQKKKSPVALTGATRRSAVSRETPENRRQLIDIAKRGIAHVEAGITPSQTDEVVEIPVEHYLDQERWEQEVALFRRIPLMLALGGELRGPNSYKAMTVSQPMLRRRVVSDRGAGRHRYRSALRLPVPQLDLQPVG